MSRLLAGLALYPSLIANLVICRLLRIWNWWDQIDPLLFVGARPFQSDVPRLYDLGVRAVVNTCEEYAGPVKTYSDYGITQLHLPTVDFTSPSLDDVKAAVAFIAEKHKQENAVYVHCKAGRGRSATIALCWLMQAHKCNPADAFRRLQGRRRQVSRNLATRRVVQQFWESVSEGS